MYHKNWSSTKKNVKSREFHDYFNFIYGNLMYFWKFAKSREVGTLNMS